MKSWYQNRIRFVQNIWSQTIQPRRLQDFLSSSVEGHAELQDTFLLSLGLLLGNLDSAPYVVLLGALQDLDAGDHHDGFGPPRL